MNAQYARKFLNGLFVLILAFIQLGCAGITSSATEVVNETTVMNTSTPPAASTLADTPTPETTATFTDTPAPTATLTPNVTATQLPEIPTAAEGKGNVVGLMLWNDQPVPNAEVLLCENFTWAYCVGANQHGSRTDRNGYYLFTNINPGRYVLATNSFGSFLFITYGDNVDVSVGANSVLDPWNIWKYDLNAVAPKTQEFIHEAKPTFRWEAYSDAAYYEITIYYGSFNPVVYDQRVDGLEFTPEEPLVTCVYQWWVHAYNANGERIATTRLSELAFSVVDVPGTCQ